jgi:glycerol transport system ATP-binding protein
VKKAKPGKKLELGVRPEFVRFAKKGLPADVVKVSDIGRYRVVETRVGATPVKLVVGEDTEVPTGKAHLAFDASHTQIYADGWLAGSRP